MCLCYIYIYIYVYLFIYVYTYVYIYIYIYIYIYHIICVYIYIYIYMLICTCMCTHLCFRSCIYTFQRMHSYSALVTVYIHISYHMHSTPAYVYATQSHVNTAITLIQIKFEFGQFCILQHPETKSSMVSASVVVCEQDLNT